MRRSTRYIRNALVLWAVLWAASTLVRFGKGVDFPPAPGQSLAEVTVDPALLRGGEGVRLAYRERNSEADERPAVLMLHGNPVAGRAMLPLAAALPDGRRVLIPDLPGLGRTSRNLKEFSAVAQATVLLTWLEEKAAGPVHLVAYSQGGPLALELAHRAPERVRSVTLIAAVGLQEHELLGRHASNQPLYAAYGLALRGARWLLPHFGLLDRPFLSASTAKNFADTDLRRTRAALETLDQPVRILHAEDDGLVPFRAAVAHARLLPQARLVRMPGGHMGIFSHTGAYADAVATFLSEVERGGAPNRAGAVPAAERWFDDEAPRTVPALQNLLVAALLFLLVFLSEDLACIGGGLLAAGGGVDFGAAVAGCFLGIWVSDVLLYTIGSLFGFRALRFKIFRRATESERFERFQRAYAENAFKVVVATRFLPGSRVIAYLTAGALRIGGVRFALWLGLAALVWTPILAGLAYWLGQPLMAWWERHGLIVLPLVLPGIWAIHFGLRMLGQAFTFRGRRLLAGRWLRLRRWEFWPMYAVYLPVLAYGAFLALRYRSAWVWTLCNPGIRPLGGLALESKSEILEALNSESGAVAAWERIGEMDTPVRRLEAVNAFRDREGLDWPVVLKPDIGQRGEGVAVVRSEAEALNYLERNTEPLIVQACIGGREYGVFYLRDPGAREGRLFSITEKVLPELTGDGESTLERLILSDRRAVAMAGHYLKVNAGRLASVPGRGERVKLVDLGTHCRGAIFLDGNAHRTEALRRALDEAVAGFDGFCFGRFDLKAADAGDLEQGRNLKILELNGVSSESTDIYDPRNSLLAAWKVLFRQWRLAFEVGAAQRKLGHTPPLTREVVRVLRSHRARQPFEVHR